MLGGMALRIALALGVQGGAVGGGTRSHMREPVAGTGTEKMPPPWRSWSESGDS